MQVQEVNKEVTPDQREKRAKAISAMGLVDREGDRFKVTTPGVRGRRKTFEVRRNEQGRVVCECPEFNEAPSESGFRCEHIMAVKYALLAQNTESAEAQGAVAPVAASDENRNDIPEDKTLTESRGSARGEQERTTVQAEDSSTGRDGQQEAGAVSLEVTQGDKEMKQSNLKEVTRDQVDAADDNGNGHDNVFDFSTTLKELRRNVDPKLVKQREGWRDRNGNVQMVDYVEWHTVADILDETAPNWTHAVKDIRQIGDIMTVTVAITIDDITREGIGTGNAHNEMGIKKAEHDALKRAAVKFGIARELYRKESDVIEREGSSSFTNDEGFPNEPVAKNLNDLVTAKQLGMIRAIARELGVDPNEECQSVMNCNTDELSKKAASALIDHLKEMQNNSGAPAQVPFRRAG